VRHCILQAAVRQTSTSRPTTRHPVVLWTADDPEECGWTLNPMRNRAETALPRSSPSPHLCASPRVTSSALQVMSWACSPRRTMTFRPGRQSSAYSPLSEPLPRSRLSALEDASRCLRQIRCQTEAQNRMQSYRNSPFGGQRSKVWNRRNLSFHHGLVAARGRMLSSVRPWMRHDDSRRPVWEFADRVQITQSVLEALW
jgi:hypothetical protein